MRLPRPTLVVDVTFAALILPCRARAAASRGRRLPALRTAPGRARRSRSSDSDQSTPVKLTRKQEAPTPRTSQIRPVQLTPPPCAYPVVGRPPAPAKGHGARPAAPPRLRLLRAPLPFRRSGADAPGPACCLRWPVTPAPLPFSSEKREALARRAASSESDA